MIYRPSMRCLLSLIVCGVLLVGCESDNDDKPITEEQAEAEVEDVSLFGTWKGIAGTGQVNVTLKLEPSDGSHLDAVGLLTWPRNDVRSVFGSYQNGNQTKVELEVSTSGTSGGGLGSDADFWHLTIQGNTMTGVGRKPAYQGGTYAVSLTKS